MNFCGSLRVAGTSACACSYTAISSSTQRSFLFPLPMTLGTSVSSSSRVIRPSASPVTAFGQQFRSVTNARPQRRRGAVTEEMRFGSPRAPGNGSEHSTGDNPSSPPSKTAKRKVLTRSMLEKLYRTCPRPAKPNPFDIRLKQDTKPFFPIMTKNLRDNVRHKNGLPRRGNGAGSRGHTPLRHGKGGKRGWNRGGERMWEGGYANPMWRSVARWPQAVRERVRKKKFEPLNLARIRYFIETGRLDPRFPITQRHLAESRCVRPIRYGVQLFNVNDYPFPYKIHLEVGGHLPAGPAIVAGADQSSIEVIKAVGGTVTIVYHTPLCLRAHLKPHKFDVLPRSARPSKHVHYLEKMRAKGCLVRYIRPLWLIREEQKIKSDLQEAMATNWIMKEGGDGGREGGNGEVGRAAM